MLKRTVWEKKPGPGVKRLPNLPVHVFDCPMKALGEAWAQRDHFTEKGWKAKLWEIEAEWVSR